MENIHNNIITHTVHACTGSSSALNHCYISGQAFRDHLLTYYAVGLDVIFQLTCLFAGLLKLIVFIYFVCEICLKSEIIHITPG